MDGYLAAVHPYRRQALLLCDGVGYFAECPTHG